MYENEETAIIADTAKGAITKISEILCFDADRYETKKKPAQPSSDNAVINLINSVVEYKDQLISGCLWLISFYFLADTFTLMTDSSALDNKTIMMQHAMIDKQAVVRSYGLNLDLDLIQGDREVRGFLFAAAVL